MLLDSSVIIEIFRKPSGSKEFEKITAAIGDGEAYVSIVQLAEVADWANRNGAPPKERVDAVRELARIVPLDEGICLDAAAIKRQRCKTGHDDFGLIDGIILASARSIGQRVLTLDDDFLGEDDCVVI